MSTHNEQFHDKKKKKKKKSSTYSSKIDICIQARLNKLIYSINTILKCSIWLHLTARKISISFLFLNWIKNEMIFFFYRISELMLAKWLRDMLKSHFISRTRDWNFTGAPFYDCINTKYQFFRNMEPLDIYFLELSEELRGDSKTSSN